MASTLKTEVVQNPSSATTNITLDASGGVALGQNLSVTGTTSLTGAATLTGNATAAAFIPSGSTVPTNGVYLSAANTVGIATNSTAALTISSAQNTTSAGTVVMSSPFTMRNKIINGAMVIDQRNAGASTTVATSGYYSCDRWQCGITSASKFSIQQNAGSVTPPIGFSNYLGITSLSSYSVAAGDTFLISQNIEGFNIADLAWGGANAQTVTLSFWARSSLTGTFGGSLANNDNTRSYPFSYTISSANTWTYITVTVLGDTSGTWQINNSTGIKIRFGLGSGSTFSGTAGAWVGSNIIQPTGNVSVVGTNGATFYITGVQLERGTVATPFEYRNYQQELAMCQRYYEMSYDIGVAPGTASNTSGVTAAAIFGLSGVVSTGLIMSIFKVTKRATPTITLYSPNNGASGNVYQFGAANNKAGASQYIGMNSFQGYSTALTDSGDINFGYHWTAASEL